MERERSERPGKEERGTQNVQTRVFCRREGLLCTVVQRGLIVQNVGRQRVSGRAKIMQKCSGYISEHRSQVVKKNGRGALQKEPVGPQGYNEGPYSGLKGMGEAGTCVRPLAEGRGGGGVTMAAHGVHPAISGADMRPALYAVRCNWLQRATLSASTSSSTALTANS